MTKSTTMWAIIGNYGLYTGTWFTRKEAIREHCHENLIIPSTLHPDIQSAWRRCQKNGDKAVKVKITWKEPK